MAKDVIPYPKKKSGKLDDVSRAQHRPDKNYTGIFNELSARAVTIALVE